ncbi:Trk-type K+ transport system membrane component [Bacillus pakistanensis]|uniref:Trk-type K+ transport system membrane component n=2 Tax=Rossellomorea pakistanensis TaxID=992288 RepID=A0ABS2NFH3_9BACI|nr:Trk-type K+ transport system membrane component [Bacillus pakistanensis]
MDSVFTAVSAVSVTGLSVINISDTYTTGGVIVLMLVLQFGGIGIMTLGTFFWLILGKKIGLRERQLIMVDQNQSNLSGVVSLIIEILKIMIIIEAIGALLLSIYFTRYFATWEEAFLHGVFASVSATTNGGFDITGNSLVPYANDYFVQMIHIILITLGAIGFPVLIEVKGFLSGKKEHFRFSLFAKLTSVTFLLLLIAGTILIYIMEFQHFFADKKWHEAFFYSLFQSASTRSGGLATLDVSQFSEATLLVMSLLMFIGASPSSVGGGIRTTTFAISVLFVIHFARGKDTVKVFRREIYQGDIIKAFVVIMLALIMCFTSIVILMLTEDFSIIQIVFEVCSAFGTTGMSLGITAELSNIGKIIIMILMFIGRVGLLSFLFMMGGKKYKSNYHYPKERVIIG